MSTVNDNPDRQELGFGKVVEDAVGLNCKKCDGGLVSLSTYADYWTDEDCDNHILSSIDITAFYCDSCESLSSFNITVQQDDC